MSRLIIAGVAAVAAATLAPQAPVMAQNGAHASPPITVVAPGSRQLRTTDKLHPNLMVVSQSVVYTDDLDLRTQSGRDALDDRVQAAAEQTCVRVQQVDPPSGLMPGGYSDCVYAAVQEAQNQIYAAISNA